MCCRGLHRNANPAYLRGFLCSGLPCVAPYCVPGGVRVVSAFWRSVPSSISFRSLPSNLFLHLASQDFLSERAQLGVWGHTPPRISGGHPSTPAA
jgi:hypothetical protein